MSLALEGRFLSTGPPGEVPGRDNLYHLICTSLSPVSAPQHLSRFLSLLDLPIMQQTKGPHLAQKGSLPSNWSGLMPLWTLHTLFTGV